ncbi:MAG TPA: ribonuclease III domain-containing protein [Clostridia bacterium]|jgi:ribonuclease-3 family protein|nr:ribonuclease III domain-containing protein [Clostridia bacterium]
MKRLDNYLKGLEEYIGEVQPGDLSPLVLAYVGDACFELYIRSRVVAENPKLPPQKLHRLTVGYVSASSQSDIIHGIWEHLNESERAVVKRGRNAKSGTSPKNADVVQYRYATGFETLVGYLFLAGEAERLLFILEKAYDFFCAQQ